MKPTMPRLVMLNITILCATCAFDTNASLRQGKLDACTENGYITEPERNWIYENEFKEHTNYEHYAYGHDEINGYIAKGVPTDHPLSASSQCADLLHYIPTTVRVTL